MNLKRNQILVLMSIVALVVSLQFLYESLLYRGANYSGNWFGVPTTASVMIDTVLYSIIILTMVSFTLTFLLYDAKTK